MKMFKKLMAVALVGVMALSMLTGCAVSDAIAEDKAEKALENAYKTATGETVNFKSLKVDSSVTSPVKTDIKNGMQRPYRVAIRSTMSWLLPSPRALPRLRTGSILLLMS